MQNILLFGLFLFFTVSSHFSSQNTANACKGAPIISKEILPPNGIINHIHGDVGYGKITIGVILKTSYTDTKPTYVEKTLDENVPYKTPSGKYIYKVFVVNSSQTMSDTDAYSDSVGIPMPGFNTYVENVKRDGDNFIRSMDLKDDQ